MRSLKELLSRGISRRESMKLSGMALGGFAIRRSLHANYGQQSDGCTFDPPCYPIPEDGPSTEKYTYYDNLDEMDYSTPAYPPVLPNEMRITFLGSCIPPTRLSQAMMSIFVEVGSGPGGLALDQACFDMGSGAFANYGAMNINCGRMDKVFISHLHGDHMSDMMHLYCFGPANDRKSPQFVFSHGPSGVRTQRPNPTTYADGVAAYCRHLREACRWHSESFSFERTAYAPGEYTLPTRADWGLKRDLVQVSDDPPTDGYAMYPIELDWRNTDVAYNNASTGLKITHFPVVHCRQGSMGFKVEWRDLSMIYTSDTKPELNTIVQGSNGGKGVDVLIHEMVPPPEIWAMQMLHLKKPGSGDVWDSVLEDVQNVQDSSHTPQGAFGYLLKQIYPRPRLTVATHFAVSDAQVACALRSINAHCPDIGTDYTKLADYGMIWSFDRMVVRILGGTPKPLITVHKAKVNAFGFAPEPHLLSQNLATPKYHDRNGEPDPFYQIDTSTVIKPGPDTFCDNGY